ncbi:DUF362 domain-containing protein [Chloroflexota bacterium]
MNSVYIYKIQNNIQDLIDRAFSLFEIDERLRKVGHVVIKPNIVSDVPEYIQNGCNTDIRVIEAIIANLNKRNVKVILGESDTGTKVKGRDLQRALSHMGIYELQKKYDFDIVNFSRDDELVEVEIPKAKALKSIKLPKTILDSDLIINVPKLKTHKYTTMTCSLKNMFGVIPDPLRIKYHGHIHEVISDLNSLFYQKMFIVGDGITGMEGAGPLYGTPVDMNILFFADNPLAADIVAARIMGLTVDDIKYLVMFNEMYMGLDPDSVEIEGDNIGSIMRPFTKARKNWFIKFEGELMKHWFITRIIFNDWIRKHITYRINPIIKKLRGGSYTWYDR